MKIDKNRKKWTKYFRIWLVMAVLAAGLTVFPVMASENRGLNLEGGIGQYIGSLFGLTEDGTFSLKNAEIEKIPVQTYTGKEVRPSPKVTYFGMQLKRGTDYKVTYTNNIRVGTAKCKITGMGGYSGTRTVSFQIKRKGSTSSSSSSGKTSNASKKFNVKLSASSYTYNGEYRKPSVKVTAGSKSISSRYYTVSYKDNRSVGTATVTVKGKGDYKNYQGSATFLINFKKPAISSAKAGEAGEINVTWKKDSQAEGVEIQCCTRKTFSGDVKSTKVKTGTSTTVKRLTSGKTWYVRMRTYKKNGSRNLYSEWSTVKEVKVK